MSSFTAIDFETATPDRSSICQVGLVVVEKCQIVDRIKILVKPPGNKYHQRCIDVHGIVPDDTCDAETFDKVYEKIRRHIIGNNLVAHNMAFDIDCLRKTLNHYRLPWPRAVLFCTMKIYNCGLDVACAMNGIKLNHHDALSDAEACALLMIKDITRK
jgi:DNA polymerase-3 subunit epsilon